MPKFRKKPVVIEAWQVWLSGTNSSRYFHEMPEWLEKAYEDEVVSNVGPRVAAARVQIKTLEGDMMADNGDWIIQGIKGELYSCKPDIFAATYEDADARAQSNSREHTTCYLDRSKVREIIFESSQIDNEMTISLIKDIDALPIFTAEDMRGVAQDQSRAI
jgi:hypothetical protein